MQLVSDGGKGEASVKSHVVFLGTFGLLIRPKVPKKTKGPKAMSLLLEDQMVFPGAQKDALIAGQKLLEKTC